MVSVIAQGDRALLGQSGIVKLFERTEQRKPPRPERTSNISG
jgi:hypothetical protein